MKWNNASVTSGELTPLNQDLALAANWTKVYDDKNIGIVGIKHTI